MLESSVNPERYSLVVITDDEELYPEIRKHLGDDLRTSLASNENEIKYALEQPGLHAILFNLDCVGDGPLDGIDALEEIRKIRDDVVLVAITRTHSRTIPLKASQAGADEFFLYPLNYDARGITSCSASSSDASVDTSKIDSGCCSVNDLLSDHRLLRRKVTGGRLLAFWPRII